MDDATELDPETWVDEHGDSLFRFAVARIRDPEAAADLVQETFLAALAARSGFSGRSSVRTWLVGILKRKVADRLRAADRERRFQQAESPEGTVAGPFDRRGHWQTPPLDWGGDPLREFERREFWEVLEGCLSKIPAHMGLAFIGREIESESREAICRDQNITPENLSVRLFRARLLLRQCLETNWFRGRASRSDAPPAMSEAAAGPGR